MVGIFIIASIDIKIEDNLLIASVTGVLTADEVIAVVKEYYPNGIVKDVIWDLTNGSLNAISRSGFESIAKVTRQILENGFRKGGKTVFVGTRAAEFGLMRMYSTIAEMTGIVIDYRVFKTIEEAQNYIVNADLTAF